VARAVPEPSHVSPVRREMCMWARRPSPRVARLSNECASTQAVVKRSRRRYIQYRPGPCRPLTSLYRTGPWRDCLQSQWHTDSKSSSARVEVSFSPRPRTAHLRSASRNQVRCALQASHTRHDLMYYVCAPYAPGPRPGPVHRTLEESGTRRRFSPASCEVGHTR